MKKIFLLFGLIFSCGFCFGFPCVLQFVEAGTGYVAAKNVEREFNPFNFVYGIAENNESFCSELSSVSGSDSNSNKNQYENSFADTQNVVQKYVPDSIPGIAPNFKVLAAVQFSDKIFDFTTLGNYFIPRLNQETESQKVGFGTEFIYHFQRYYDLYSEHDIYIEGIFRFVLKNRFAFFAKLGSGLKFARIDAIDRDFIWDFTLSGSLSLNYYLNSGAEIFGSIVSHELFRYPLAFTPVYSFGAAYNFKNGFRISSDVGLRLRDQFVVAPYIDRYEWNLKARFSF